MGPRMAGDALRKAISHGADEGILLTDRAFAGSDTLATSNALAHAIRTIGAERPVDLVFCGKQSIDGDTGQVGPGLAWRLGVQQLTYVTRIEAVDPQAGEIVARRRTSGGEQVVKTALPCLITMLEGTTTLRFGSMADAFRAAECDITSWSAADAGVGTPGGVGLAGSPTKVTKVFAPQPRSEKARMVDSHGLSPAEIAAGVVDALVADHPDLMRDLSRNLAARERTKEAVDG
jgi:electron transfer flavoprotein beta subunit